MNSEGLSSLGFLSWYEFHPDNEFNLISLLPSVFGVYVIRSNRQICRFQGYSDIVYIGCTWNRQGIKNRIRQYFHPGPTQSTNIRILEIIKQSKEFSLSFRACQTKEETNNLEKSLLDMYLVDHMELPPFNRSR